jgi:hypothetical protein
MGREVAPARGRGAALAVFSTSENVDEQAPLVLPATTGRKISR